MCNDKLQAQFGGGPGEKAAMTSLAVYPTKIIDKNDLYSLLSPIPFHASSKSYEHRKAVVDRIRAFRRKVTGHGLVVDALIEFNQQERDRD